MLKLLVAVQSEAPVASDALMPGLAHWIALALIAVVLLGYVLWIVDSLRRSPYTLDQSFVFFGCVLLTRLLWRAQVPAGLPIDAKQGAVLVANHRSSIDPFFLQLLARRRVHWMVAAEFGRNKLIKWLYDYTQVIPTSRSGRDTGATKKAIELAAAGGLVGMFPEGQINTTDEPLLAARPGAVLIAAKAGVPIVPIYIDDSPYAGSALSPFFMPGFVRVKVGEPIELHSWADSIDEREALEAATLHVLREVLKLGGHDEFEPRLAGRKWSVNASDA